MHEILQGGPNSTEVTSPHSSGAPSPQLQFLHAPLMAAAAAAPPPPPPSVAYVQCPSYAPMQHAYHTPPMSFAMIPAPVASPAAAVPVPAAAPQQFPQSSGFAGVEAYGYTYVPVQVPQPQAAAARPGQQLLQQQAHPLFQGSPASPYPTPSAYSMFGGAAGGPAAIRAHDGDGGGSYGWRGALAQRAPAPAPPRAPLGAATGGSALGAAAGCVAGPYPGLTVEDVLAFLARRPQGSSAVRAVGHLLPALDSRAVAALLKELHKRGMALAANEVFEWLRSLPPGHKCHELADVYTYTTMIAQCTGPSQLHRALGLAADMRARGVPLNTHTFSALINVCIKAGAPQLALDSYAQMLAEGLTPNLVTFNTLLEAFAKQAMWEEAVSTLESLQGQGLCPETRTYSLAMNACNAAGRHAQALAIFGAMTAAGRAPTTASFNAAITAHCGLGNLEAAWATLQEMAHRSCERTPTTYTTLLRGAEAAGDWRFALDALDAMAESGLRPTPQAYTCAISACAAAGQLAAARDLTARLQAGGGGGGVAPAHLLILMHDRCCDWRAVRAVFDDLSASGVRPDGASFGALAAALWGCGSASSCLLALRVFEEACELGVFKLSLRVDEDDSRVVFTLPSFGPGMAVIGLWRLFQELALRLARDGAGILRRRVLVLVGQPSEAGKEHVVEAMAAFCATQGAPFALVQPTGVSAVAEPPAAVRLAAPSDALIKWLASAVPAGALAASAGAPGPGPLMVPPALLRGLAHDSVLSQQEASITAAAAVYARVRRVSGGSSRRASNEEGPAAAAGAAAALQLIGAAPDCARGDAAAAAWAVRSSSVAAQTGTGSGSTSATPGATGTTSPGATPSISRSLTPAESLGNMLATASAAIAGSPPPPIALAMPSSPTATVPPLLTLGVQFDPAPALPPAAAAPFGLPPTAAAAAACAAHFAGLPRSHSAGHLLAGGGGSGSFYSHSAAAAGSTGSRSSSAAAPATLKAATAAISVLCGVLLAGPGGELPEAAVLGRGAREIAAQAAAHPLSRGVAQHRVAELSLMAARRAAGLWPAWPRALVAVTSCADPEAAAARPDLVAYLSALAASAAATPTAGPRSA